MRSKFTVLQRLLGPLTDSLSVVKSPTPINYLIDSPIDPPVDPFELPYLKQRYVREMPFYPEKTLFVYRAKETYRNAEEKALLKKKKEAGFEKRDEISTMFRVRLDDFDYNVAVALPDETPFEEAALAMSSSASAMLSNRLARAQKKHQHVQDSDTVPSHTLFETTFRVSASDMSRSLKQTMLDDEVVSVEILEGGKEKERIPYTIRWLQYPLEGVTIPFCPREGFPLAALVETKRGAQSLVFPSSHAEVPSYPHGLRYCWFTMEASAGKARAPTKEAIEWVREGESGWRPHLKDAQFVCEAASFTPTEEHVGKYIAVTASCMPATRLCSPVGDSAPSSPAPCSSFAAPLWTVTGKSTEVVVDRSVGEELLAAAKMRWAREDERKRREEGDESRFRLVSYNLLADQYINLALPAAKLFYPYVDKKYQHMRYRYSLTLKELEGYSADLYFLQEVCQKMAFHYLPSLFKQRNYGYAFHRKYAEVREGSGVVWSKTRFEERSNWCRWLTDVLEDEGNEDIRALLSRATPEDRKFFEDRPTLVHIMQLADIRTGDIVIVGNTHLHHDPRHEHYKTLQTALVTRELARRVREAKEGFEGGDGKSGRIRVLFGSDLNSTPEAAVVALLSGRTIAADDAVWAADERMGGMELQLPAELRGMANLSGEPAFTNYTEHQTMNEDGALEKKGFAGCIDYIWACGLETVAVSEQPSEEEIKRHTALPSPIAPSDHLAIVLSARYLN